MIKFKGQKVVSVYKEASPSVAGGTMVSNGGYVGTFRQQNFFFFFDDVVKVAGGKEVIRKNRVTNVTKEGKYKKCQLVGV